MVVEQFGVVGELRVLFIGGEQVVHRLDHRVVGVQLEDALGLRYRLVHGGEDALHLRVHVAVVGDEATGAVGQPVGEANLLHVVLEAVLHFLDEFLVLAGGFLFLFVGDFLFLLGAEVDVALGDGLELLFVVLAETGQDKLIHRLGHEQYLDLLFLEHLEVR